MSTQVRSGGGGGGRTKSKAGKENKENAGGETDDQKQQQQQLQPKGGKATNNNSDGGTGGDKPQKGGKGTDNNSSGGGGSKGQQDKQHQQQTTTHTIKTKQPTAEQIRIAQITDIKSGMDDPKIQEKIQKLMETTQRSEEASVGGPTHRRPAAGCQRLPEQVCGQRRQQPAAQVQSHQQLTEHADFARSKRFAVGVPERQPVQQLLAA